MEDEGEPLCGGERLQDDEQCESDGVRQQGLMLGVELVLAADERVGHVHVEGRLTVGLPRAEHVQAHPRNDRRQPAGEVLHIACVGAAGSQPRLLECVVGVRHRAEHSICDRPQARPMLLEPLREQFAFVHGVTSSLTECHTSVTLPTREM